MEYRHIIFFRVDAGSAIGWGHIKRCIYLARAYKKAGFRIIFISQFDHNTFELINLEKFEIIFLPKYVEEIPFWKFDSDETYKILKRYKICLLILDSYALGIEWQRNISKLCDIKLLVLDDSINKDFYADYVLSQSPDIPLNKRHLLLNKKKPSLFLGGGKYLLTSDIYTSGRKKFNINKAVTKIGLFFGSSDCLNYSVYFYKLIRENLSARCNIKILTTTSNLNLNLINDAVAGDNNVDIILNADNLKQFFESIDFAILACGSSIYDCLLVGCPAIVGTTAPNQIQISNFLEKNKLLKVVDFNNEKIVIKNAISFYKNNEVRSLYANSINNEIDAYGPNRVALSSLREFLKVRYAKPSDALFFWECRNHKEIRKFSKNADPIILNDHEEWYREKISDKKSLYFVADFGLENIGYLRYDDLGNSRFKISIAVLPQYQGVGVANFLLVETFDILKKLYDDSLIELQAHINSKNFRSKKLFLKLGFILENDIYIKRIV